MMQTTSLHTFTTSTQINNPCAMLSAGFSSIQKPVDYRLEGSKGVREGWDG